MKTRMTRKQFGKTALLGGASLAAGMLRMLEALMVFYPDQAPPGFWTTHARFGPGSDSIPVDMNDPYGWYEHQRRGAFAGYFKQARANGVTRSFTRKCRQGAGLLATIGSQRSVSPGERGDARRRQRRPGAA